MQAAHRRIVESFVPLPTAPFCESAGLAYLREFVAKRRALSAKADRFGNLLVRYAGPTRSGRKRRSVLFAGHLDHPGFVTTGVDRAGRITADFRGWVDRDYFLGAKVRLFAPEGEIVAVVDSVDGQTRPRKPRNADPRVQSFRAEKPPERATLRAKRPVPPGTIGMWDFPGVRIHGTTLSARACDDVVGVAAILCMLDALCRTRARGECYAFFTRAEEVGFAGALAAVADRTVPRSAVIVAVECSRAVTGVTIGAGPILRVGDKATVFSPAPTAWCRQVAERLAERDASFQFQRKLMDGGTCESTAYCHYGYDATGICLPLGNYHNMDRDRRRIAPEYIDTRDFENLVKWFVALATADQAYAATDPALDKRLDLLLRTHRPRLLQSAGIARGG